MWATQTLTLADGSTQTISTAQCNGYRAACGRCALDAAATSSTIQVIGNEEPTLKVSNITP